MVGDNNEIGNTNQRAHTYVYIDVCVCVCVRLRACEYVCAECWRVCVRIYIMCVCVCVFILLTASFVSLHPSCNRLNTAPIDSASLPTPTPVSIPVPSLAPSLCPGPPCGTVWSAVPGLFLGDVTSLLAPDDALDLVWG